MPNTAQPNTGGSGNGRIPYIRGLDGLRALGVLAVLLYHADVGWMKGGFLGVELFFVVSGFLITTLLLAELRDRGRLDVRAFWWRRARRLLPAAFTLILATVVFAVAFLPDEVANLRGDAAAALGYVSNWYLIFDDQSYFESVGRPSLLRHLWSLAVEEQFYIVWPLVIVALLGRLPRWSAYVVVLALAGASLALMAYLYDAASDSSRVYYGTDTRLGGLLIGAALAFLWSSEVARERLSRLPWPAVDIVGMLALAAVVYAFFGIGVYDRALYQGGFAAFGLVSAALILTAAHPKSRLPAWILSRQPLRWAGLRSYSIYLWHWPVFMLTRPQLDVEIDGIELLAVRFAIVLALAEVSYRLVETPFRSGAVGHFFSSALWLRGASLRTAALHWAPPAFSVGALALLLGISVAAAGPPEPPSYLAVSQVQTTSWSNTGGLPQPTVVPTPNAAAKAAPVRPEIASPASVGPAVATATPSPTESAGSAVPSASATPTPVATPEPAPSPTAPPAPPPEGRVFALGDSVMLGAAPQLPPYLGDVEVDAAIGRQANEALSILRQRKEAGVLGDAVVLHIGNNGIVTSEQLDEALQLLADVPEVVVVNVKVPREWEGPNNAVLAAVVPKYGNAVLIDWNEASRSRPELFHDDGIHLQPAGAEYYAQMIAAALGER